MNAVERLSWLSRLAATPSATEAMLRVGIALALHMNAQTGRCDPSTGTLAAETGMQPRSVTRALRALEDTGAVLADRTLGGNRRSTNRYRFRLPLTDGSPLTDESPLPLTDESPLPLTDESVTPDSRVTQTGKNREREQGRRAPAPRGSRLTFESLPQDWEEWTREHRPDLDPAETFERFADYWRAIPGAKGLKSDWKATWRNWCRRESGANGRRQSSGPEPVGAAYRTMVFED